MSAQTGLDIRYPLGALFAALGALLVGYGALTRSTPGHYASSLGYDIDLWWGLLMLVFGLSLVGLARRGGRASGVHEAEEMPEGEAMEDREHDEGLEH